MVWQDTDLVYSILEADAVSNTDIPLIQAEVNLEPWKDQCQTGDQYCSSKN